MTSRKDSNGSTIPVSADTGGNCHHRLYPLPDGNVLAVSNMGECGPCAVFASMDDYNERCDDAEWFTVQDAEAFSCESEIASAVEDCFYMGKDGHVDSGVLDVCVSTIGNIAADGEIAYGNNGEA